MRNETYLSPFSGYVRPAANVFGSTPLGARNPISETVGALSRALDGINVEATKKEDFLKSLTDFASSPSDDSGAAVVDRLLEMDISLADLAPGTAIQFRRGVVGLIDFAKISSSEKMTAALLRVGHTVFERQP